ncbi:MAG TPA: metallophosphoesterase [Dissulfurispiraceae bacterium]|nr:metallophosphoesterase [Dissulfurispiraceae bacterium]
MRLFLLVFFLLYGGLHIHAFLKAKAAFGFGMIPGIILAIIFAIMLFAPLIIRLAENAGLEQFARTMAWTGYCWMGVLFLFFSASLLVDLYRVLVYAGSSVLHKDAALLTLSAKGAFLVPLFISLCASAYGYMDALNIRTEHITIETAKLPQGVDRLRIVQISDVHLGLIVRQERLGLILDKVKHADPDILVSTGDLVDGQINGLQGLADMLMNVNPRFGKYAVLGNHEYYAGLKQAVAFKKAAGFTLLRSEMANIGDIFTLVGVDDPAAINFNGYDESAEMRLLSSAPRDRFTVLLKHRPLINKDSVGLFDLQLSGHVHKGQIFPFSILTKLYYPKHAGMLKANGSILYVSRGTGTWGPPIRFLAPPEVTVVDIVRTTERKGPD